MTTESEMSAHGIGPDMLENNRNNLQSLVQLHHWCMGLTSRAIFSQISLKGVHDGHYAMKLKEQQSIFVCQINKNINPRLVSSKLGHSLANKRSE